MSTRLLTLPSGWRIQFGPNTNFIFETHDLTHASPATVSRMAMIFLSDEDTNITGLVAAWTSRQPEDKQETLRRLIEEMFFKAVDWCVKANDAVIETSLVGLVLNGLSHLSGVTNRLQFGVALVRGLGGNLMPTSRENFAKEVSFLSFASPVSRCGAGVGSLYQAATPFLFSTTLQEIDWKLTQGLQPP